jgi:hypothetical protein
MRQSTRLVRRASRHGITALTALLALTLLAPAMADAGCGGTRQQAPKPSQKRVKGRPPLAIGDSVMLLALEALAKRGFVANARGCRGFDEGLAVVRRRRAKDKLPHLVVLALGADFTISRRQIRIALHLLGKDRVLGLVTPRELGGGSGRDAANVRWAGRRYPKRVTVLDWVEASRGRGGWFQPDGLHLTFAGAYHFAKLIARSLPLAGPPRGSS